MRLTLLFFFLIFSGTCLEAAQRVVNVYSWAYAIPEDVIQQFEKETGIQVHYDVYDASEVMETKLLAGNSGYDVVMVTIWPYFEREREAQLFQPLSRDLLTHWGLLDKDLLKKMETADPGNQYAVPFLWGTTGFAFNRKLIEERLPEDAPFHSHAMLFDPQLVARFAECGISLLDSPSDVIPAVLSYLGKDPNSTDEGHLKEASAILQKIRPFLRKFQTVPGAGTLLSGDYCVVEGFSGELLQAQKLGKEQGLDIQFVIPEEGAELWVDGLTIPKDAPHVPEAHAFINFMLRPDIIAQITNALETANAVPASRSLVREDIMANPLIFLSEERRDKLYTDKAHTPHYERLRLREWTRIKIGR